MQWVHESAGSDAPALLLAAGLPDTRTHLHEVKTYTERWKYFRLDLLSPDEAADALSVPLEKRGVTIDAAALKTIVHEVDGYPYFVQEYGAAIWTAQEGNRITKAIADAVVPGVRRTLDSSLYDGLFQRLTGRELRYAFALAKLGAGAHRVGEVAAVLDSTSKDVNWIRNQLIKKDVIFVPAPELVEFRLPLTERYIERHRRVLMRRIPSASPSISK
ncbi:MAG TPA: hypothetical protein VME66_06835 [Candidatus Acidoferrales bacterium]|nr:hypothetical protein [Candidatus Acidoferrales bacterium]